MSEIELTDALGHRVSGISCMPAGAKSVVVMSHGYTSNKDSRIYRELADELATAGIGSVRYDYYGHGPAYGHGPGYGASPDVTLTKALESLNAAVKYVREFDLQIGLIGSSFGGLLSQIAASRDPNIRALGLKSPVTDPVMFWLDRLRGCDATLDDWRRDGILHYREVVEYDLPLEFWEDLQRYDTLAEARRISCPTLIVHGDRDMCVPIHQSEYLAKALGTKVAAVRGADHTYSEPEHYGTAKRLLRDFMVTNLP